MPEPPLKKKQPQPPPTAAGGESKTVGAKFYQKKQYKDAYAAAKRGRKAGNAASKQAATAANTLAEKAKAAVQEIVVQNKTLWAGLGIAALMVMLIMGAFSSCSAAIQGTGSTFIGTTYPSKDADMKGAEEDYLELEKEGAPFEELEKLTLGGLRRAVVDGDVKTGSVMSGQIAGMVKDEKSCKEIIEQMMNEMEELLKGAPARL